MRFQTKGNTKVDTKGGLVFINYVIDKCFIDNIKFPYKDVVLKNNNLLEGKYKSKSIKVSEIANFLEYYDILTLNKKYVISENLSSTYDIDMPRLLIFFHFTVALNSYPYKKEKALIINKKIIVDYKKLFNIIYSNVCSHKIPNIRDYNPNIIINSSEAIYIQDIIDSTLLLMYFCVNQQKYGIDFVGCPYEIFTFFLTSYSKKEEQLIDNEITTLYDYLFYSKYEKKKHLFNELLIREPYTPLFELFEEEDRNYVYYKLFNYTTYDTEYYYPFINTYNFLYSSPIPLPHYYHSPITQLSLPLTTPSSSLHYVNNTGLNCHNPDLLDEMQKKMQKKFIKEYKYLTLKKVSKNKQHNPEEVTNILKNTILNENLLFKRCHWLISEINQHRKSPYYITFQLNVKNNYDKSKGKRVTYSFGGRQYNELAKSGFKEKRYAYLNEEGYNIEIDFHSAIFLITRALNFDLFDIEWDLKKELLKYGFKDSDGIPLNKDNIKPLLFTIYFAPSKKQSWTWYKNRKFPEDWMYFITKKDLDDLPSLSKATFDSIYKATFDFIGDNSKYINNIFFIESFIELYVIWRFTELGYDIENVYDCFYLKSKQLSEERATQLIEKFTKEALKQFKSMDAFMYDPEKNSVVN